MNESGLQNVDTVIVGQPEFLSALNANLKKFPLEDWKNYLIYHFTIGMAAYLDDATYQEMFSFYAQTIKGVKQPKPITMLTTICRTTNWLFLFAISFSLY